MKKIIKIFTLTLVFFVFNINHASAHVTVKPESVVTAKFQTFTVSVPVEKEIGTTEVRLEIPEGLKHVTPNVKNGWEVIRELDEGQNVVQELVWKGYIPPGFREEFNFSAQVPAKEGMIAWKAYQTYEDGSVVEWAYDPETKEGEQYPYSITNVVSETEPAKAAEEKNLLSQISTEHILIVSLVAIFLSISANFRKIKGK